MKGLFRSEYVESWTGCFVVLSSHKLRVLRPPGDEDVNGQGLTLSTLLEVTMKRLVTDHPLDAKFRDHPLKGGYAGCRECHLKPDLLLIYVQTDNELCPIRLGSNSELFA